ncbi:MAG: hypothetical protein KGI37_01435 [Alphaproteobacteria bacterium]|nr:hypothetical protein [Alphaproteobacteria bacterium]
MMSVPIPATTRLSGPLFRLRLDGATPEQAQWIAGFNAAASRMAVQNGVPDSAPVRPVAPWESYPFAVRPRDHAPVIAATNFIPFMKGCARLAGISNNYIPEPMAV